MKTAAISLTLACAAIVVPGCGGSSKGEERQALQNYLARVEPIRLGTNDLLDRADPILAAYREHRLRPAEAERRFGALERSFAAYTLQIAALSPVPSAIRAAHDAYAHTYVLEDAYLSALDAGIPGRHFDNLPNTQNDQRATIIAWRTRLQVVADQLGTSLPADIQVAGRGEIAPSPTSS